LQTPSDWPQGDTIDLSVHDLPHPSSDTEWWYFNCHLADSKQREFSLFACFFMYRLPEQADMAYSAIWALTDCQTESYTTYACVDKNTPTIALQKLSKNAQTDVGFKQAIEEILQQKRLPSNDRLLTTVNIADDELHLQFDQLNLRKTSELDYVLTLTNPQTNHQVQLQFKPVKPACYQGDNGVIAGPRQETMYYYFIPRCQVLGQIQEGANPPVSVHGQGWYDHEFGFHQANEKHASSNQWTWISIQLDNGYDLSLYKLCPTDDAEKETLYCTLVDPTGQQQFFPHAQFRVKAHWKSLQTFSDYECQWTIHIDDIELSLEVNAQFNNQEFPTLIAYPAFWEGRFQVKGTIRGKPVTGMSYVEQFQKESLGKMTDLFDSVSEQVDKEIQKLMPLQLDKHHSISLFASQENSHYLDDVDCQQLADTIVAPIRTITDRKGKRWRSYVLTACCHLVGGTFDNYASWLTVPEFIHTGSLIIDDIQDQSAIRRGGPACHQIFGEPLAMNAGSFVYGLFEVVLNQSDLSAESKCQIYQLFFDTYRAAHVGQALDLIGFLPEFIREIESGNGEPLLRRITAAHRLKSAVPASLLAKMGVVLGRGSQQQADAVARYFEAVGIAFQIMDDVLNLRGFDNNHKQTAEDITAGKVTYPMAKAIKYLNKDELFWIVEVLQCHSEDRKSHQLIVDILESSGVFDACCQEAQAIIDNAWQQFDPLFPQSHTKMVLRSFSHYIIQRTV
jgi:geranylgeranyl pyrophosphate synthase/predicted secreted hydrolase